MHTSKDDYLINTLRFVSVIEETQIYGAILPDSLTSPEMKKPKCIRLTLVFLQVLYLLKRRESSRSQPLLNSLLSQFQLKNLWAMSKKKEKVDVTRGKGIELLSQVALNKDAQFEEVRKKSMRDFHKTHPSGFGAVKIIPPVTSEGTGVKLGVPDVTEEESSKNSDHETKENKSGLESDHEENEEDQKEVKDKLVKTLSNDSDDKDEIKITDKAEGDEDEEMYYTTSQLHNDVDIRLNEQVDTDKEFVQEEGTDAAMTNIQ
ncbi:hypothetical protein Tco_0606680 [Tanacetum coccineum]